MSSRFAGHPTLTKEAFSLACVEAMAYAAGCAINHVEVDDHKVDFILSRRGLASGKVRSPRIDVQLKATSSPKFTDRGQTLAFDVDLDLFDELRATDRHLPIVLMVMCVPIDPADWATVLAHHTELRDALYYVNIYGFGASGNQTGQRIDIPVANIVTPDVLNGLLNRVDHSPELL